MVLINIESTEALEDIVERALEKVLSKATPKEVSNDTLLNRLQAAEFLNISLGTLHLHTKEGRICGQRIGNRLLYRKADLESAIQPTLKQK